MFNFMRMLRAQVELHKPNVVYYVLEGYPKARHEALGTYKGNRTAEAKVKEDDPDREAKIKKLVDEHSNFMRLATETVGLMRSTFPITVVRHPDHECDDVIAMLVKTFCADPANGDQQDEAIIVSSDTDFIQLLRPYNRCRLFNPQTKKFVAASEHDYVQWKALKGDGSDNIDGIPGVGPKTADLFMEDPKALDEFLQGHPEAMQVFQRNTSLIRFHDFSEEDLEGLETYVGKADWDRVKQVFERYGFKSITNDKSWKKFTETFDAAAGVMTR